MSTPLWKRVLRVAILGAAVLGLSYLLLPVIPHERLTERMMPTPSRVYARPMVLAPGTRLSLADLQAHLRRVGYRRVAAPESVGRGEFHSAKAEVVVGRRPFRYPDGSDEGGILRVAFEDGGERVTSLLDETGVYHETAFIEPEVVGTLFGEETRDRLLVPLNGIPQLLQQAVLVTEDRRFNLHPGIDPIRIAGAALENVREGRVVEGGSTLTQQLVKNVYLTPERTWQRKVREMAIAMWISLRYSKVEVLEAYLNQIYLGQDGGRAIHGVGRAARFYFGKDVTQLDASEAALLAGMIQAPSALSPFRHPEGAMARRNLILGLMREQGVIDAAEHDVAVKAKLGVRREERPPLFAAHYVDFVRRRLQQRFADEALERDGFDVFTTLDGTFQRAAESAVTTGLRDLEKGYPLLKRKKSPLQAALVAIDPASGDVVAWVGGRDYASAPFDRASRARRQPGSVFKPIVALAAFTAPDAGPLTLATVLEDAPLDVAVEDTTWSPRNHDGKYRGPVSLRHALEHSLNVPFARLGMEVGLVHVAETARRLGVASPLRPIPSLSLGAFEMTPLEVALAYATLASGGVRHGARTTLAVVEPSGRALRGDPVDDERVFGAEEAYLVTTALEGAVDRGTGRTLRRLGIEGPMAGKTGTTNEFRDAWFVGYTPDLVIAVWVGFDDGARVGLTGARAALPIFARFVKSALPLEARRPFEIPASVTTADVHAASGLLATDRCPGTPEVFIAGTAPTANACQRGTWPRWLRGWMGSGQRR